MLDSRLCPALRSALFVSLSLGGTSYARAAPPSFRTLQPGVEYAAITVPASYKTPTTIKDRRLHVVRIDPKTTKLRALMASKEGTRSRTAKAWAKDKKLAVVINLGMYLKDHKTHVGYLRAHGHENNKGWHQKYLSALALGPKKSGGAPLLWLDLSTSQRATSQRATSQRATSRRTVPPQLADYDLVVQNLRLIRREGKKGVSVWAAKKRRWSEAALALDDKGRLLFLFTRVPLTMAAFNRFVLSLPIGVVAAQHVEGGPEASLSIHTGGLNLDLSGSYESGFVETDGNASQWPIPNVLAVPR